MNKRFLQKARELIPELIETEAAPVSGTFGEPLGEGGSVLFDFGNHFVGYVRLELSSEGSIPDAPAFIKVEFFESAHELDEDKSSYHGWISKSWIQEEYVHVDILPETLELKRRYAFRYVRVTALALSNKYKLRVDGLSARTVTSAQKNIDPIGNNDLEKSVDKAALRTLSECMQHEFEDGPKRDRRLWLGDLRLQALVNYETFKQNDLVKRCLYLFAGAADEQNRISACVFTKPQVLPDDTYMFDYSLLFISTLLDYYLETRDLETIKDLFNTAWAQIKNSQSYFDKGGLIKDSTKLGWCFLDWVLDLNKQAGAQAVYIYCAKAMAELCGILGVESKSKILERDIKEKEEAAKNYLFDSEKNLFVSGDEKQISYASNVWFVLSGIFGEDQNRRILTALESAGAVKPVTPYMYHHYVQALLKANMRNKAYEVMMNYWGAMIEDGADTFYELFNPDNPQESPYGSKIVNSYCHAWSCAPSYFLRKYFYRGKL